MSPITYRPLQQIALIVLRTIIGWHFLYEAYYKIWSPAWGPSGPLPRWTSAGYLKGASGPLAGLFQRMVDAGWTTWIDRSVKIALLLIGLSLILGLFTRIGAAARNTPQSPSHRHSRKPNVKRPSESFQSW